MAVAAASPTRETGHFERPLFVMVAGLRGLVGVQGGIETHARMLYPLLARLGCRVEVVQRSPYYPRKRRRRQWHGLALTYLWSPTRPGLETAVHTLLCVLYAAIRRPDILHLHAIGPGLLAPLARLFGLRVVLTHHATDYEREKWGPLAKWLLQAGESLGVRFATRPIAVSRAIQRDLQNRLGVNVAVIPNGAPRARPAPGHEVLDGFGLRRRRYVLCVARLEPTKRQLDLIDAFEQAELDGWKLVLVGSAASGGNYHRQLEARATRNRNIVLTGYQTGSALCELYSHAGLFVLPSSLEGHPIALLEAASYGIPILASAISANFSIPLPREQFFPVGDVGTLGQLLRYATANRRELDAWCGRINEAVRSKYSWRSAAYRTRSVYAQASTDEPLAGLRHAHG